LRSAYNKNDSTKTDFINRGNKYSTNVHVQYGPQTDNALITTSINTMRYDTILYTIRYVYDTILYTILYTKQYYVRYDLNDTCTIRYYIRYDTINETILVRYVTIYETILYTKRYYVRNDTMYETILCTKRYLYFSIL